MDLIIYPGKLSGTVAATPSKSYLHRLLICAAFAESQTQIPCNTVSKDILATISCLNALGAKITCTSSRITVLPITDPKENPHLYCSESGTTLRMLLPIVGALGCGGIFHMEGRLSRRPLSPLWEELESKGCSLSWLSPQTLLCTGKLSGGSYTMTGTVSSQFISGLLFAQSLIGEPCSLTITGRLESAPYVKMTEDVFRKFGYRAGAAPSYPPFHSPGSIIPEGDWSNAAFFLAANMLGSQVTLTGLSYPSQQGDSSISNLLDQLQEFQEIDATQIPDLVPVLAVAAACRQGALFTGTQRLRLKESDRVLSVCHMLNRLGISAMHTDRNMQIAPGVISGGIVDSCGDHRIAMAAAIASTVSNGDILLMDAQCVQKSYPDFWTDFSQLGGHYEQYLR